MLLFISIGINPMLILYIIFVPASVCYYFKGVFQREAERGVMLAMGGEGRHAKTDINAEGGDCDDDVVVDSQVKQSESFWPEVSYVMFFSDCIDILKII